jgi:acetyltransferase-like isoleucine patch superfamily enzyme
MANNLEYYGGLLPWTRHALRVFLNRIWSRVLRSGLASGGAAFNVDFTSRILGGKHVVIGSNFYAGRGFKLVVANATASGVLVRIGHRVGVNEFVTIAAYDSMTFGDNVLIGSRVYLGNIGHGSYKGPDQSEPDLPPNDRPFSGTGPTIIGDNVWIGEGAILPGGITVGTGSIIGAGSVVTKNVPAHVIVAGNPARIVKEFDRRANVWKPVDPAAFRAQPNSNWSAPILHR